MSTETIELVVDVDTARAYRAATDDARQRVGTLVGVWLKQPGNRPEISPARVRSEKAPGPGDGGER